MLDRIKSFIGEFEPRDVTIRDAIIFFVVLGSLIACGGVALLINKLSQRTNVLPTPIFSPTSEPAPTPLLQAVDIQPTITLPAPTAAPTIAPTAALEKVNTPTRFIGESCIYSEAWINNVATPIPDGGFSAYEGYFCDNGYWDIGNADWVDKAGNWGEDGSLEEAFIKFNGEGVVIDRLFFDLNGNKIPGPVK